MLCFWLVALAGLQEKIWQHPARLHAPAVGGERVSERHAGSGQMAMHLTHVATIDCGIDGLCAVIPARQW